MAAVAAMASVSVVGAPVAVQKLSSSAAFGASQTQFAPLRSVNVSGGRVVAVTADYSEEEGISARRVMSSVLAAGLAITMAGSAFAASGPGGAGAERTARKADKLLKGADSLIKNDSPQRFGPFGGDNEDADRGSRKAGSGAIPDLQDASSAQIAGARDKVASNLETAKRRIDGIWGQGKGLANDVVTAAQGKADDATKDAKKSFFGAAPKINLGSNASNAAGDVKGKADDAVASAGGFFGKIKQQGGATGGDVKGKADEAAASAGGFFGKIKQQGRALQNKK